MKISSLNFLHYFRNAAYVIQEFEQRFAYFIYLVSFSCKYYFYSLEVLLLQTLNHDNQKRLNDGKLNEYEILTNFLVKKINVIKYIFNRILPENILTDNTIKRIFIDFLSFQRKSNNFSFLVIK